ncbi:MAG: acyltransferase family protein [Actinomycetes bacterium]
MSEDPRPTATATAPAARRGRRTLKVPYEPGIDGLRAIAVTSVLLYHSDIAWVPGGFFGVEVFFVISGYLITALLLAEWRNTERLRMGDFYIRRARRLLPALFLMLAVVGLYAVVFLPDDLHTLRGDTLAAIGYVQNWWQIFAGRSYFEQTGRPPLLQHLWSLAVEEQFYLLWPLMFWVLLKAFGRRPMRLVGVLVGAALASTILMWVLFPGIDDPTRVYYGTDTRAAGLLLGSALAILWPPWRLTRAVHLAGRLVLNAIGAAGLAFVAWYLFRVPDTAAWVYRGGFLWLDLATLLVIAVVVHPGADLRRLLGWKPLVWIGLRSYSLYLWHWPIYQVTRPGLDVGFDGYPLLALRLTLTVICAELSYRYVETPIRQGALSRAWRAVRDGSGEARAALVQRVTAIGAVSLVVVTVVGVGFAGAQPPRAPKELRVGAISGVLGGTGVPGGSGATGTSGASGATGVPAPPPPPPAGANVMAVGDSVMLGAAQTLAQVYPGLNVNAAVSRQFGTVADVVGQLHTAGFGRDVTIIHTGSNGTIDANRFVQMMQGLADVRCVVVLNLKVPRRWEAANNNVLAVHTPQFPNATLIDWHGEGLAHGDWFYQDGIHLNATGRNAYVQLIATIAPTCGK